MENRTLYSTLAIAGVLPFLACALLPLAGVESIPPFGPLDQLANSYGLAIVCFLAGIHWATYLFRQDELPFNLMVSSNVVFLAAWFMFVLGGIAWSLVTQIVALVFLLLVDWRLKTNAIIAEHYFLARMVATTLAVAALILILLH